MVCVVCVVCGYDECVFCTGAAWYHFCVSVFSIYMVYVACDVFCGLCYVWCVIYEVSGVCYKV